MSKVLITQSKLDSLANVIASKSGTPVPLTIAEMEAAVRDIHAGGSDALVVTLSFSRSDNLFHPDKTFAEIKEAFDSDKQVVLFCDQSTLRGSISEACAAIVDHTSAYIVYCVYAYDDANNGVVWAGYRYNAGGVSYIGDHYYGGNHALQSVGVSYTPTESSQSYTIVPNVGFDGLSDVTVDIGAISSNYIGTGVTRHSLLDIEESNGVVTVPSGYYASTLNYNVTNAATQAQKVVKFIDYDGSLLYSYTVDEFQQLSSLPQNPSHTGLVAQGWNYTKQQIADQLTGDPNQVITVGQMYTTSSGATEIDIVLREGATNPFLSLSVNGSVRIDWGDNSEYDTMNNEGYSDFINKRQSHVYAPGSYTIKITAITGSYKFINSYDCPVLSIDGNTTCESAYNRVYPNSIKAIRIGGDATSIEGGAFYNYYSLASITIPNSVTTIGYNAFFSCRSLTSVTIPSGVTSIALQAFDGCYSLASISIPSSVTSIGSEVFYNCNSLDSIMIPNGVTSIEARMFSYCYSLRSVTIPSSVTSINVNAFSNCRSLISVTIPNGVTRIENGTFNSCYSLTSVTIPSSVTSIGEQAFYYCQSLQSVTIPSSVTRIGANAFDYCYSLKSVTIPNSVTRIDNYAFSRCFSLSSVTIPGSVTIFGNYLFAYCNSLVSVIIQNGVTSMGNYAFYNCYSLSSVTIPSGMTNIGQYAFHSCLSLTSITIPNSVTSIGNYAFYNCYSLSSVTIPSSVTTIGQFAFRYCQGATVFHVLSETPPGISSDVFEYVALGFIIYVPSSSVSAYKAATNWSTYELNIQGE